MKRLIAFAIAGIAANASPSGLWLEHQSHSASWRGINQPRRAPERKGAAAKIKRSSRKAARKKGKK